jgi:GTPase SAR1 family protein
VLNSDWPVEATHKQHTTAAAMLSILRKARLKDKELRILMLGLDNAGKTTIVKQIMGEDVHTVSPTLGFIIKTIDYEGYKLNICTSTTATADAGR